MLVLYLPAALPTSLALMPIGFIVLAVAFLMPDGISGLLARTYRRYAERHSKG
jgi:hypothetical protein